MMSENSKQEMASSSAVGSGSLGEQQLAAKIEEGEEEEEEGGSVVRECGHLSSVTCISGAQADSAGTAQASPGRRDAETGDSATERACCDQDCDQLRAEPLTLSEQSAGQQKHETSSGTGLDNSESEHMDNDEKKAAKFGDVCHSNELRSDRACEDACPPHSQSTVGSEAPSIPHCCSGKHSDQSSSSHITCTEEQSISMKRDPHCDQGPDHRTVCTPRAPSESDQDCDQSSSSCTVIDLRTNSKSKLNPEPLPVNKHRRPEGEEGVDERSCAGDDVAGTWEVFQRVGQEDGGPGGKRDCDDCDCHGAEPSSPVCAAQSVPGGGDSQGTQSPDPSSEDSRGSTIVCDRESLCCDDSQDNQASDCDRDSTDVYNEEDSTDSTSTCDREARGVLSEDKRCSKSAVSVTAHSASREDSVSPARVTEHPCASSEGRNSTAAVSHLRPPAVTTVDSRGCASKGVSTSSQLKTRDIVDECGGGGLDSSVSIKEEPADDHLFPGLVSAQPPPSPSSCSQSGVSPVTLPFGSGAVLQRIKQEPEDEDLPKPWDTCFEDGGQSDVLSGLYSGQAVFPERVPQSLHIPLHHHHHHHNHHHHHMRNVYISFASTATKKIKCDFPGGVDNDLCSFQQHGQSVYSSSSSADSARTTTTTSSSSSLELQEKTSDYSGSDNEMLPIHFESQRRGRGIGMGVGNGCSALPIKLEVQQRRGLGDELLYECGMCQVGFSLPGQCHEHVIQHEASDRCYVCGACKTSFQHMALLTQHVPLHTFAEGAQQLAYDNPKAFVCHVCAKVFRRLYELNRHQSIHSGNKPFSCDTCFKTFARIDELRRHVKVHSGVRPFPCEDCSRAFITRHELNQHVKSHAEHKPFVCQVCSRGFLRADKLFHHQQMHAGDRPHPCEVCHKGFITQSELRQHKKIHSGVKPYVCQVCCKAYLKMNDLNRHMKIHTGQKPFTCDVCGKAFHRTDILTRHKKIHNRSKIVRRGRPPKAVVTAS